MKIIKRFLGYVNKRDKTNLPEALRNKGLVGYLVEGSQNVLINDDEKIAIREGYSLYGSSSSNTTPIRSAYVWNTHRGDELPIRFYDDEMEVYTGSSWRQVSDGLDDDCTWSFAEYWDTNEGQDILLMVNGDDDCVFAWSGGIAVIDSTTSNTITKTGTTSWAEEGFISDGTDFDKTININGTDYTYTGGESTTTLTGVTPDPTGEADGSYCIQQLTSTNDIPAANFYPEFISVLNNQVWYGNSENRQVYVSAVNDWNDVTYSSPRVPGEGALFTLDGCPTGFVTQEDSMYISAGKDQWYKSDFTLRDDGTKFIEDVSVLRLKSGQQSAAQSQDLICRIKNGAVFVSNEPTLDELARLEDVDTPQSKPLSDPIKADFDDTIDFTDGDSIYYKSKIYLAEPANDRVWIYDIGKGFWQPPQLLPVRRFAIIGGELYGHSSQVPETYKLFDGNNDNGAPIHAIAKLNYRSFGRRDWYKIFDEAYDEGYISKNTELTIKLNYDYEGSETQKEWTIDGTSNEDILFESVKDASLGKQSLGKHPLGTVTDEPSELVKFRAIKELQPHNFFEIQKVYESTNIDEQWEILAWGFNVKKSEDYPVNIKI